MLSPYYIKCLGTLDGRSAYEENYQAPALDSRLKATRPSTALRLSGDHELKSGYQQEYVNAPALPHHCLAGELVEGIRRHRHLHKTPHFKLKDVSIYLQLISR